MDFLLLLVSEIIEGSLPFIRKIVHHAGVVRTIVTGMTINGVSRGGKSGCNRCHRAIHA